MYETMSNDIAWITYYQDFISQGKSHIQAEKLAHRAWLEPANSTPELHSAKWQANAVCPTRMH